jgi:hypothetical protein
VPDDIKSKCAWKKAFEWIKDRTKYAKVWDLETGPPSLDEFTDAVKECANNKGVNRDGIPIEFWKNADAARQLLCKMVRKVWTQILEGKPIEIPEDWVDATLVCLYKGKGKRKDPAMHRGISLISMVEKIISIIILKRIKCSVDQRLLQGQNGFRSLKSCRDAVFQLWREMEKSNKANEAFILTFIDYSKAFDSLDWARLWQVLEFAGCPKELVQVIKSLYELSTISIRITADGELATSFSQKRGIRQGSSLSPCLFVLAMDFCLRVFQEACDDLKLPSHEGTWTAYADDVADKSLSEDEATKALQQLEAASAFVGLRLNVSKTEVMAKGIRMATVPTDKPATKERVIVEFKEGKKKREGWMVAARDAHHLTGVKVDLDALEIQSPVMVYFEQGDSMLFEYRGSNGWLKDLDGNAHRFRRLGSVTFLEKKHQSKHFCENCGGNFDGAAALRSHKTGVWCRHFENMSIKEQLRLRRTRVESATRRGKTVRKVEMVTVQTCENLKTKSCGEFIYLGSKLDTSTSATPEIRRRINMAMASFGKMNRIWRANSLSRKTKSALYKAIILTIMLYNAEVWPIKKQDMTALEGAHFVMMRRMLTGRTADAHITKEQLLSAFDLQLIANFITRKRMSWIGHALRRSDGDRSKNAVRSALEDTGASWTKLVMADCKELKIDFNDLNILVGDRSKWKCSTFVSPRMKHNAESQSSSSSNSRRASISNSSHNRSDPAVQQRRSKRLRGLDPS